MYSHHGHQEKSATHNLWEKAERLNRVSVTNELNGMNITAARADEETRDKNQIDSKVFTVTGPRGQRTHKTE